MKTARTPEELGNPDYNYYFAYNIDPAEKDSKKIELAMAKQKNTFTQGTPVQRRLKELYDDALAIMIDNLSRDREYQAAKKLRLERAEKTVMSVIRGRAIYKSEIKKMADKSGKWLTAQDIEQKVGYLFEQGARLVDDTKGNMDFLSYEKIGRLLKTSGKNDLYDVLGLTNKEPLKALQDAVTETYRKVQASGKTDAKATATNQMCGEARNIFKDENSKKYYDIYLATKDVWEEFADRRDHGISEMVNEGFLNFFQRIKDALQTDDKEFIETLLAEGLLFFRLTVAGRRTDGVTPEAEAEMRMRIDAEMRAKVEVELAQAKIKALAEAQVNAAKFEADAKRKEKEDAAAKRKVLWRMIFAMGMGRTSTGGVLRRILFFILAMILIRYLIPAMCSSTSSASTPAPAPVPVTKTKEEPAVSLDSRYLFAMSLYTDEKYDMAVIYLKGLAEEGHAPSQYYYGHCFEYGNGVAKDLLQANSWYLRSAGQGFALAQYELGVNYREGIGVAKDVDKAAEWFLKAANKGNAQAQNALGWAYENGEGVQKDNVQAAEWFRKAAEQGNRTAQFNYANCFYEGKGLKRDFTKAFEWYRKAAEQGHRTAQFNLGGCYANGHGVGEDFAKAAEWFTKAAEQGDENAKQILEKMKADGKI